MYTTPRVRRRRWPADRRARDLGPRLVIPLCAGAVLNPLNSTMIATALSPVSREFSVGAGEVAWLLSVLYLASAIGQPVAGRLADAFGPRRVFLAGGLLVAAGGALGALGPTFAWLVAARAVVGLGTGAAYPSAVAMIREQADRLGLPTPARLLGLLNTTGLVALMVGPLLGGVLVDAVGWRAVFAVNVLLGLASTVLGLMYLPRSRPRVREVPAWRLLDVAGIAFFSGTVTLLLLVLTTLSHPSWPLIVALPAFLCALVLVELRARTPFIDVRMLASNSALMATYLRVTLSFIVIYGVLFGFTPWLQDVRALSASAAGLLLLAMSGVGIASSVVGVRGSRMLWSLLLPAVSLLAGGLALLLVDGRTPVLVLLGVVMLFGLPNGMGPVANQVMVFRAAPAEHSGAAAGLSRTAQYIGAMIATGVVGLSFADGVNAVGLRHLSLAFIAIAGVLLAVTLADRGLRRKLEA